MHRSIAIKCQNAFTKPNGTARTSDFTCQTERLKELQFSDSIPPIQSMHALKRLSSNHLSLNVWYENIQKRSILSDKRNATGVPGFVLDDFFFIFNDLSQISFGLSNAELTWGYFLRKSDSEELKLGQKAPFLRTHVMHVQGRTRLDKLIFFRWKVWIRPFEWMIKFSLFKLRPFSFY